MGTDTPIYNLMVVADPNVRIIAVNRVDLDGRKLNTRGISGDDIARKPGSASVRSLLRKA